MPDFVEIRKTFCKRTKNGQTNGGVDVQRLHFKASCHIKSHSVTFYPSQVNAP